jgi:outer membrane biosynthesis protein TonB
MTEQPMQTHTVWGIAADDSLRRVSLLAALSLLAHILFLSPLGALLGLLTLSTPEVDDVPFEALTEIPVSLLDDEGGGVEQPVVPPAAEPPQPAPAEPAVVPLPKAPTVKPATPTPVPSASAEKPKPKPQTQDAGAPAAKPRPQPKPEARPDAGAKPVASADPSKPPTIANPTALVGSAANLTDQKANVQLLIHTERIRGHLLGERIGALFSVLPQWQSFLGGARIDMVRDVDTILLAGPQFRRSDQVMVILDYNAPQAQMRAAIDQIVKRDANGRWLDTKFPAAIATADRAQRLFALPQKRLVIVSPLSAQDSVMKQGPTLRFTKPKGGEAVVTLIKTPWRVFLGTQFDFPKSIKSLRLIATPIGTGDVDVVVVAEDTSAEAAKENARAISKMINEAAQLGGLGSILAGFGFSPLIDRVELQAQDKKIHGALHVTAAQLKRILGFAESWAETMSGQRRAPPAPKAPKPSPATSLGASPAERPAKPPAAAESSTAPAAPAPQPAAPAPSAAP